MKNIHIILKCIFLKIDSSFNIDKQNIVPLKRNGFTLIEWGGSEIKYQIKTSNQIICNIPKLRI